VWLTNQTLSNASANELPIITADHVAALENVLGRRLSEKSKRSKNGGAAVAVPPGADRTRYEAYSVKAIQACCEELAIAAEGGRNIAAFNAACKLGRWAHHGFIAPDALEARLVAACETNGLVGEDGREAALMTIQSGLNASRNDPLPELPDRPVSDRRVEPVSVSSRTPSTLITQDSIALYFVERVDRRLIYCHHRANEASGYSICLRRSSQVSKCIRESNDRVLRRGAAWPS
jgi:hypothetical protein